jgi:hypothetical protein
LEERGFRQGGLEYKRRNVCYENIVMHEIKSSDRKYDYTYMTGMGSKKTEE